MFLLRGSSRKVAAVVTPPAVKPIEAPIIAGSTEGNTAVVDVYRAIHSAIKEAFAGDLSALALTRSRLQMEFRAKAGLVAAGTDIREQLEQAGGVAVYLKNEIIQAEVTERGSAKLKVKPEHLSTSKDFGRGI